MATTLKIDPGPPVYSGADIFYGVIPDPENVAFEHPILQGSDNKVSYSHACSNVLQMNPEQSEMKSHPKILHFEY